MCCRLMSLTWQKPDMADYFKLAGAAISQLLQPALHSCSIQWSTLPISSLKGVGQLCCQAPAPEPALRDCTALAHSCTLQCTLCCQD